MNAHASTHRALALLAILAAVPAAAAPAGAALLPPDGARFLVHQRFDVRVEGQVSGPVTAKLWVDGKQAATGSITLNLSFSPGVPNLAPYQPSGWSDKIVLSATAGKITDDSVLSSNQTLYVNLAVANRGNARAVNTFDVKVRYDTINAAGKRETPTLETKAKTKFVKAGDEATKPNADLDAVIGLAQLVRAQIAAEASARAGCRAGSGCHPPALRCVSGRGAPRSAIPFAHWSPAVRCGKPC